MVIIPLLGVAMMIIVIILLLEMATIVHCQYSANTMSGHDRHCDYSVARNGHDHLCNYSTVALFCRIYTILVFQ